MDSGVAGMTSVEIIVFKPQHLDEVRALWEITEGIGVRDNETDERILVFLERNPGMSFVAISRLETDWLGIVWTRWSARLFPPSRRES